MAYSSKEEHYQTAARNVFLNEQFLKISKLFSDANIPLIPLKGIALIQNIYTDWGFRYLGDIDILVKAEDVLKSAEILSALGYTHRKVYFDRQFPYSIYLNSLVFCQSSKINYSLHLHWHLLNTTLPFFMYQLNMDDIWADARIERTKDGDLVMMAAHQLLVYLSLHAFHHSFESPVLLQDIKKAVEFYKAELDWPGALDCAKRWNARMPFYLALYLTSRIYGADIPEDIINSVKPDKISKNGQRAIALILKNGKGWQNVAYPLFLDMTQSLWDRAKFVFLSFFPAPKHLARFYGLKQNIFLPFLYYLRRFSWAVAQSIRFFLLRG